MRAHNKVKNMFKKWLACGALALPALSVAQTPAQTWSAQLEDLSGASAKTISYSPQDKAGKPWKICALFPHMKDTIWLAMNYGVVEEARRQGAAVTIYQAGGYENLPKQLAQFDDCMASNFDALIVGAISEAGLARKFREAEKAGKPVIAVLNPVNKAPTTSKVFANNVIMGEQTGEYLAKAAGDKPSKIVALPGPAGSGWAEQFAEGLKNVVSKSDKLELLDEKFGDTGVAVQLGLVQNSLQAYPDVNVLWGNATMIEAAIGAVQEAGRNDVKLIAAYENQAMLEALRSGQILGFATQYPVLQGRLSVDLAIRALEGQQVPAFLSPIPRMVSKESLADIDMDAVLAPSDYKAVYAVEASAK